MINNINLIYRISDSSRNLALDSHSKIKLLHNLIRLIDFKTIIIIADNCTDDTVKILKKNFSDKVHLTSLGNVKSFKYAIKLALLFHDNEIVYFCEDDYYHSRKLLEMNFNDIKLLFNNFDYLSFYSHPDKFNDSSCKLSKLIYCNLSEKTYLKKIKSDIVFRTSSSTTLTFLTKSLTLKRDINIWTLFLGNNKGLPRDAFIWEIITSSYNFKLISLKNLVKIITIYIFNIFKKKSFLGIPISSYSEHLDTNILSSSVIKSYINDI